MNKHLLITGSTGYLGSYITDLFLKNNYKILCTVHNDGLSLGYLQNYPNNLNFIDVDEKSFANKIKQFNPNLIIHTAARYENNSATVEEIMDSNLYFPLRLLNIVLECDTKPLWINTNTSLPKMLNTYSLSKVQFAEWGKYYSLKNKIDFTDILLEQFYGPNDSGSKFFPFLLSKMEKGEDINLTDGLQKRDIIYVDDVINAFLLIAESRLEGYNLVPLGTGIAPRIRDIVEELNQLLGYPSNLKFGAIEKRENEPDILVADISKLKEIGFVPKVHWQDGLKKII